MTVRTAILYTFLPERSLVMIADCTYFMWTTC